MNTTNKDQMKAGLNAILAVSEAIRGLGRVPNGHLYAQVCGHLTLEAYTKIIGILKGAGVVEEKNHELFWIGPAVQS